MHPAYEEVGIMENYPNSNMVMQKMFFVGCSPTITHAMIDYIEEVISNFRLK